MSKWVVLFSKTGVDTLIPCDLVDQQEIMESFVCEVEKAGNSLLHHVSLAVTRAKFANMNGPEVWVYTANESVAKDEAEMRKLWEDHPQVMADLVREKGICLYKEAGSKQVIQ